MAEVNIKLWKNIVRDAQGNIGQDANLVDDYVHAVATYTRLVGTVDTILSNVKATELTTYKRPEDGKTQARSVFELVIREEMLNAFDVIHGGSIAYLIDICSSVTLTLSNVVAREPTDIVSQSINTNHHSGAPRGAKLEIVSVTTAIGSRTASARTEIWDATNRRLVASGVHTMMRPTVAKVKVKM